MIKSKLGSYLHALNVHIHRHHHGNLARYLEPSKWLICGYRLQIISLDCDYTRGVARGYSPQLLQRLPTGHFYLLESGCYGQAISGLPLVHRAHTTSERLLGVPVPVPVWHSIRSVSTSLADTRLCNVFACVWITGCRATLPATSTRLPCSACLQTLVVRYLGRNPSAPTLLASSPTAQRGRMRIFGALLHCLRLSHCPQFF